MSICIQNQRHVSKSTSSINRDTHTNPPRQTAVSNIFPRRRFKSLARGVFRPSRYSLHIITFSQNTAGSFGAAASD